MEKLSEHEKNTKVLNFILISKLIDISIVKEFLEMTNWDETKAVSLFFEKNKDYLNKIKNTHIGNEDKSKQKILRTKNKTIFTVSEDIYYNQKNDEKYENKIYTDENPLIFKYGNLSSYQNSNYYSNKNEVYKSDSNEKIFNEIEKKSYNDEKPLNFEKENNFSLPKKVHFNINEINEENLNLLNDNIKSKISNNTFKINQDKKKYFNINEVDEENSNEIIDKNQNIDYFEKKGLNFNDNKHYEEHGHCINGFKLMTIDENKMIAKKMQSVICKIKNNGKMGTGFFVKIPFHRTQYCIFALLTNNHILSKKDIEPGKTITFSIYDNCEYYKIFLDNRKILTFERPYDITLIEIKKDDGLDISLFLEADEKNDYSSLKDKNPIYLLQYPLGDKPLYSLGRIKSINGYDIHHSCISEKGSSGGPIINLNNHKVIAIHKGENKKKALNAGTLINFIINKLEEEVFDNLDNYRYSLYQNLKPIGNNLIKNDPENEITIQYKLSKNMVVEMINKINIFNKEYVINLFGKEFVKNNKDFCDIIFKNKDYELCNEFKLEKDKINEDFFRIKLRGVKNIKDLSYMFYGCSNLESVSHWKPKDVNLMNHMFYKCSSLIKIPDFSEWDVKNVKNMSYMFYECSSLENIFGISNWDVSNVNNISHIFDGCSSLLNLPEKLNWNIKNVEDISFLFNKCEKLNHLPDISNWKIDNVRYMNYLFSDCSSLLNIPKIENWKTNRVIDMEFMFSNCQKLAYLPDISNWDTSNVINMSNMFSYCESLLKLPDISNWNVGNVTNMNEMFFCCLSLKNFPDLTKWNVQNLKNCKDMFTFYELLNEEIKKKFPEDTNSKEYISNYLFSNFKKGCSIGERLNHKMIDIISELI